MVYLVWILGHVVSDYGLCAALCCGALARSVGGYTVYAELQHCYLAAAMRQRDCGFVMLSHLLSN